jgi:hypothetical protein
MERVVGLRAAAIGLTSLSCLSQAVDVAEFQRALTLSDKSAAAAALEQPGSARLVHERLMDFLTYNAYHLPMYARVGLTQ